MQPSACFSSSRARILSGSSVRVKLVALQWPSLPSFSNILCPLKAESMNTPSPSIWQRPYIPYAMLKCHPRSTTSPCPCREQAAAQGLPLTCLRFQHHSGVANVAPVEAPLVLPPGEEATATAADAMHAGESADAAGVGAEGSSSSSAAAGSGGGAYIHDSLGGLRFRISPVAFFQVRFHMTGSISCRTSSLKTHL